MCRARFRLAVTAIVAGMLASTVQALEIIDWGIRAPQPGNSASAASGPSNQNGGDALNALFGAGPSDLLNASIKPLAAFPDTLFYLNADIRLTAGEWLLSSDGAHYPSGLEPSGLEPSRLKPSGHEALLR